MSETILALRRTGRGRPVVFLGGCPTAWDVLSVFAAAITTTHEAIEVALPGYGSSPPLPGRYTLEAAEASIAATLLAGGVKECAVVGFSGGAYRALSLALGRRIAVTRVFCLSGLAGLAPEEATGFRQFAAAVRAGQDLRPLAAPRFLSPAFAASHPEAVRAVGDWLSAASTEVIAGELEAFADAKDLAPSLGALQIPVIARVGSADAAAPVAKSEAIAKACPSGRLEVVDGAGHALMYEDVEGTLASMRRWLSL
jgi:pimeloyl-ACP methyl ester carboxylesterase